MARAPTQSQQLAVLIERVGHVNENLDRHRQESKVALEAHTLLHREHMTALQKEMAVMRQQQAETHQLAVATNTKVDKVFHRAGGGVAVLAVIGGLVTWASGLLNFSVSPK